jgi:uncharacterized protein (TIGR03435 family)
MVVLALLARNSLGAQVQPTQPPPVPLWETAAGTKMEFDVASVKQNKTTPSPPNQPYMNFPMGSGDMYSPNGGNFIARNLPLFFYIQFAYKMTGGQVDDLLKQMPDWAKTDRFDIEAKATGEPTKDQMRLMVQSLLADRFKLAVHHEIEQVPVFALELAKPGKTGPNLRLHPADDTSCSNAPPSAPTPGPVPSARTVAGGFPVTCGGLAGVHPARRAASHWDIAMWRCP